MQINVSGSQASQLQLDDKAFAVPLNVPLLHQVVTAHMANLRAGTKAQKSRGEVSFSTRKLWRQKGTGRARVGAASSPTRRSGGVTFAASPRSFAQKVNKKMYRGALRGLWSELIRTDRLVAVDTLELGTHKTRELRAWLDRLGVGHALLIDLEVPLSLEWSARNLVGVSAQPATRVSPVELLRAPKVVVTTASLKYFEELLVC